MTDMRCPLCGADAVRAALACPCCRRPLEHAPPEPMDLVHCYACKCAFPSYLLGKWERSLISGVKEALEGQNEGRNSSCWPLVSFGGKDADLHASGCTGIKAIVGAKEDRLVFEVGGHKTFVASDCLDDVSESMHRAFDKEMQEIVCGTGFPGEWTGNDWSVHFSTTVEQVPRPGASEATAKAVIDKAREACRPFEEAMASADGCANELYEHYTKPKKAKAKAKKPGLKPGRVELSRKTKKKIGLKP